jgi:hypothetical protein
VCMCVYVCVCGERVCVILGQETRQEKKNLFGLRAWGEGVTVDVTLFVAFL